MRVRAHLPLFVSLATIVASARQARAEDLVAGHASDSVSVYRLDPLVDGTVTGSLLVLQGALAAARHQATFVPVCSASGDARCNPDELEPLDRYAVGNESKVWTAVSDWGQSAVVLPFLVDGLDLALAPAGTLRDFGVDAVVLLEAQLVASTLTSAAKLAVKRPRPSQYDPDTYAAAVGRQESFPSGHTTAATAGAASLAITYWWRNPDAPSRWAVLFASIAWAGVTGWARVEAGAHFPTDVTAGWAIGALGGVLVPALHRLDTPVTLGVIPGSNGEPAQVAATAAW